jgi:hypothetical protein
LGEAGGRSPDDSTGTLWIRCAGETWLHQTAPYRQEEAVITAIIAAVLFAIALLLHVSGQALGPLDPTFFEYAGLIAAALHLAGIGTSYRGRVRR